MRPFVRGTATAAAWVTAMAIAGCANPGPPKPPSLQLPALVTDLKADRHGTHVVLHFTVPQKTTDGLALRGSAVSARVCRAVESGTCQVVGKPPGVPIPVYPQKIADVSDELSGDLATGKPKLLTYRVELLNENGRGAGFSDAAFIAAGAAPQPVEDFRAEGSRLGVVLRWVVGADPESEVLLVREDLSAQRAAHVVSGPPTAKQNKLNFDMGKKPKTPPPIVMLNADGDALRTASDNRRRDATLDTTAVAGTTYRYTAERRRTLDLYGHSLEVWSGSAPYLLFVLNDTFPPPAPTNLSVAGFTESTPDGRSGTFAVDLIWDPVQDDHLAGYRVYRAELAGKGASTDKDTSARGTLLSAELVRSPAFHDPTANGSRRYRYSVTSVDQKGNESDAVKAVLEPSVF